MPESDDYIWDSYTSTHSYAIFKSSEQIRYIIKIILMKGIASCYIITA